MADAQWIEEDSAWATDRPLGAWRLREVFPGECEAIFGRRRIQEIVRPAGMEGHFHDLVPITHVIVVLMTIDDCRRCVRWPVASRPDGTYMVPVSIEGVKKRPALLTIRPGESWRALTKALARSAIRDGNLDGPPCNHCVTEFQATGEA
jgi:hypothetical protein